jgi:hypothetical protein
MIHRLASASPFFNIVSLLPISLHTSFDLSSQNLLLTSGLSALIFGPGVFRYSAAGRL